MSADQGAARIDLPDATATAGAAGRPDAATRVLEWKVMIAIVAVAFDLRPGIVSIGPVLPMISADLALTHMETALLTAMPASLMGVLALPTPWLSRTFGRDRVLMISLALLSISILYRAFATTLTMVLVGTFGIGATVAIVGTLVGGFIKETFPTRVAFAMSVYAAALSVGSTLSAAVTGATTSTVSSWRVATGLWSGLGLISIFAWHLGARSTARQRRPDPAFALPIRSRKAWSIAVYFGCVNFFFYGLLAWLVPMFREYGYSASSTGMMLTSFMAAFTSTNFLVGLASRCEDRRRWLLVCDGLVLAGVLPLSASPSLNPFLFVSLCAAGLGGAFTLAMTLPLDNTKSSGEADAWNALVMLIGYVIAAVGPVSIGVLRDATGTYRPSLWLLVVVGAGMLAMTPLLRPAEIRSQWRA